MAIDAGPRPFFSVVVATYGARGHIRPLADGEHVLVLHAPLKADGYSVLEIETPRLWCEFAVTGQGDRRAVGLAVADVEVEPV